MKSQVIALPGGVMPAAVRYAPLQSALGGEIDFHFKDLEVYAGDEPPPGYSVEQEVIALAGFADALQLRHFHLVGYSGGGFVSLAFAGTYPERLRSLAVFEPARVPGPLGPEEAALDRKLRQALAGAEGPEFMRAFTSLQVREGVELPPPAGPPPPWMGKRPLGLAAMLRAFGKYRFDRNQLRRCHMPVFYGYGDLTSEMVEFQAAILGGLLPDVHVMRFAGIHHFVPPEQIYTPDHIEALRQLWARGEPEERAERPTPRSASLR
ncbi:MAG: alpha/beta hydrolase [Candidatus Dormibacteraeota bacterium]|nr:alpha/beta hydrolase [Candidatus Dormibacteraeota bacterium]